MSGQSIFVPGNVYEVHIPPEERPPSAPPETAPTLRRARPERHLDLYGRTFEEVQQEADRIKLGSVFNSIEDFDRYIDSWVVIHHRAVSRFKTTPDLAARKCRFSQNVRTFTRKVKKAGEEPKSISDDESYCSDDSHNDSENQPPDCDFQNHRPENAPTRVFPQLSQEEVEDAHFRNGIQRLTQQGSVRQPLVSLPNNPSSTPLLGNTPQPIGNSSQVTMNHPQLTHNYQELSKSKPPRSIVKHTSDWLPRRHSLLSQKPGEEKVKKKSLTGACGELTRFRPTQEEDPEGFFSTDFCPWRVRAIHRARSGEVVITKCDLKHTCPQHKYKWRGPTSKSRWLGQTLAPRVITHIRGPVKELNMGFQQDYKRTTSYHQMWRAKDLVRDAYLGGQRTSFHCIPGLIERLKVTDVGCKAVWEVMEEGNTFYRAFVCPSTMRKSLAYCQPVVCLDACHTKNRKFPTQLFLATVLDGNMQILPLAWAVAPTENHDNWAWFLNLLDAAIYGIEEVHVPFMSDKCKGLISAVKDIFPGKVHGMCANHLRGNVKTRYGKAPENFFLATVYANTQELFASIIERLVKSVAKGEAAAKYISGLDPTLYARYAFPLPRFGKVTSNPCEATNSGLLSIREYAPFKLLVEMWYYAQKHFNASRKLAAACTEDLTGPALLRYKANLKTFGQWQVFDDYGGTAKVQTTTGTEEYLVSLMGRPSCTCWELQEMCWPCEHVMAWDDQEGRSSHNHFHMCWRVSSWRALYTPIIPSFICNDLPMSTECWPPEIAVKNGRHRMVRIQSGSAAAKRLAGSDLVKDSLGNLFLRYPLHDDPNNVDAMPSSDTAAARQEAPSSSRRKRKPGPNAGNCTCTKCGKVGHNRRTCKAGGPTQPDVVSSQVPMHEGDGRRDEEDLEHPELFDLNDNPSGEVPTVDTFVPVDESDVFWDTYQNGLGTPPGRPTFVPEYGMSEDDDTGPNEQQISNPQISCTQNPQPFPDYWPAGYKGNIGGLSQLQSALQLEWDAFP